MSEPVSAQIRSLMATSAHGRALSTREKILDAQLRAVLRERWDDFKAMTQDSTAVEGNVLWPTDSRLMVDLVSRMCRRGGRLDTFGLPNFGEPRIAQVLGSMSRLDREISLGSETRRNSARTRRRLYRRLLLKAHRAIALLAPQVERTQQRLQELDVLPSLRVRAARAGQRAS